MLHSHMVLQQTQLVANYTQPGSASTYIGGAQATSLQFFVEGLLESDSVQFTVQQATSKSDDHFLNTTHVVTIAYADTRHTKIITIPYEDIAGFMRLEVKPTLTTANAVDVRCQANLKGFGA